MPGYKSDHSLVKLKLDLSTLPRGPGSFKMNNSYLFEDDFKNNIKHAIRELVRNNSDSNPNTLWELIKGTIRNESIKYASRRKREKEREENTLKSNISKIEDNLNSNPNNENLKHKLLNENRKLDNLRDDKIKGILLRSKAEWIEGSEKNTAFFANLEKKRVSEKTVKLLRNKDGKLLKHNKDILTEISHFYTNLYKTDTNITYDNSIFDLIDNTLSDDQMELTAGDISEYECKLAIQQMQNNKAPGSDGISVEFYKLFWNYLKTYLMNSLNHSYQTGTLTPLQTQSLISLLPKSGKDVLSINNWRPISLLNVDYKIAAKCIANRVKKVITSIISEEQTGFIKGRYIGENVRLISEVIENANKTDEPGLIFFTDFNKAFDSLYLSFL